MIKYLKKPTASLSLFYFSSLMVVGVILSLLPLYCKHLGFSSVEVGIVCSAFALAETIFTIPWSIWADRMERPHILFKVGVILSVVLAVPLFFVNTFLALLVVVFAFSIFQIVIYPQLEVIAINESRAGRIEYGKPRSIGSLGILLMVGVGGMLAQRFGIGIVPILIFIPVIIELLASFFIPRMMHAEDHEAPLLSQIRKLISSPEISLFLLASFLAQASYGLYYGFYSIWLSGHGYSTTVIGFSWSLALLAEIVVFWKGSWLTARVSASTLIIVAFIMLAVRWILFSISANPAIVIIGQLLNASFAFSHLAAMQYLHARLPSNMKQTGQSFYNTLSFGLGATVGTMVMGTLVDKLGIPILYVISAGIALAAAGSFILAKRSAR